MSITKCLKISSSIRKLEKLGGDESFFGRQYIFEQILEEEHHKLGLTKDIMNSIYSFHGMECYGNLVDHEPSTLACERFIDEYEYSLEDLNELKEWYRRRIEVGSIDCSALAIYILLFVVSRKK